MQISWDFIGLFTSVMFLFIETLPEEVTSGSPMYFSLQVDITVENERLLRLPDIFLERIFAFKLPVGLLLVIIIC